MEYLLILGKGVSGYLKNYPKMIRAIKSFKPDIIHAHYGLSGFFATLQNIVPVVTTFHGSDLSERKNRIFSFVAMKKSKKTIFVAKNQKKIIKIKPDAIIPCGLDLELFKPIPDTKRLEKTILFSSAFSNPVKNFTLAQDALKLIDDPDIKIVELKGYSRKEVAELMNKVSLCLLTSKSEGSPQFIKEALACNCPIVSTDVGDVKDLLFQVEGTYIADNCPRDIAKKINLALKYSKKVSGRIKILEYSNNIISTKIINIYNQLLY